MRSKYIYSSIKSKLFQITISAILGIILFASLLVYENVRITNQFKEVSWLVQLTAANSQLVHELQKERGLTAGFYGSNGSSSALVALESQRNNTDIKKNNLESFLLENQRHIKHPTVLALIAHTTEQLGNLVNIRNQVNEYKINWANVFSYYNDLNKILLDAVNEIIPQNSDGAMASRLLAFYNFLQGKERAGIERAVLANTFAAKAFDDNMHSRFLGLLVEQNTFFKTFKEFVSDSQMQVYNQAMKHPSIILVERYRDEATNYNLNTKSEDWIDQATLRINQLKLVEDSLTQDILDYNIALVLKASNRLLFYLILSSVLIALAIGIVFKLVRILNQKVALLENNIEEAYHRGKELQSILDTTIDAIICIDENGSVLEWNVSAQNVFGYSKEEMIGSTLEKIIPNSSIIAHQRGIQAANSKIKLAANSNVVKAKTRQGDEINIELTVSKWVENGHSFYNAVIRDVDHAIRQRELIASVDERLTRQIGVNYLHHLVLGLSEIFNAKFAFIGLLDPELYSIQTLAFCQSNEIIENTTFSLDGSPCEKVINDDSHLIPDLVQQFYPNAKFLKKMGIVSYSGTPIKKVSGEMVGILVVMDTKSMNELTANKSLLNLFANRAATEIERIESERSLKLASQAFETHEGIVISDPYGKIEKINKAFTTITGYTSREVIGKPASILKSGRQSRDFYQEMWRKLNENGSWQGEIWNKKKNGEVYPERLGIAAVYDEDGKVQNYVGTFLDVSELTTKQFQIENQIKEQFVLAEILAAGLQANETDNFLQHSINILIENIEWIIQDNLNSVLLIKSQEQKLECSSPNSHICTQLQDFMGVFSDVARDGEITFCSDFSYCPKLDMQEGRGCYITPVFQHETLYASILLIVKNELKGCDTQRLFLSRISKAISVCLDKIETAHQLEHQAKHDNLTGLANRVFIQQRYEFIAQLSARKKEYSALLYLDLDRFKQVNDTFGHKVGDKLLSTVAKLLLGIIRQEDTLARIGGDEFIILLPMLSPETDNACNIAIKVAEKITTALSISFLIDGYELNIGVSIGLVIDKFNTISYDDSLIKADTAMYSAKADKTVSVKLYEYSIQEKYTHRLTMERLLRNAVQKDELQLYYQPQVNEEGDIYGAEALIRWFNPELGTVPPDQFIPVAEETGLIFEIGTWVIDEACKTLALLSLKFENPPIISVNISAKQLVEAQFVELLNAILIRHGVTKNLLGLEVTESTLLQDVDDVIEVMSRLHGEGYKISIDDFGTGYSSLSYLKRLPIDTIKIDRAFVRDLPNDQGNVAIASAIMILARNFNLNVVAEGVEEIHELNFLKNIECSKFQGYYFYKPMPLLEFNDLLTANLLGVNKFEKTLQHDILKG